MIIVVKIDINNLVRNEAVTKDSVFKVSHEEYNKAFETGIPWMRVIMEVVDLMKEFIDEGWDEEIEDDLVDLIADNADVFDITGLDRVMMMPIGKTNALTSIQQTLVPIKQGKEEILPMQEIIIKAFKEIAGTYSLPIPEVVMSLYSVLEDYVSRLVYWIYYQFEINKIPLNVIFEPVYQYINKYEDGNFDKFVEEMDKAVAKYRPALEVFDEYPELEEPFLEIAETYLEEIDLFTVELSCEDVMAVINSKNPGEELIRINSRK